MEDDIPKRSGGHRFKTTTPENASLASGATPPPPEFVRLPKLGRRCYWTGLTRSAMNELVLGDDPKVESVVVARKGASRGIRLVHLGSLLGHLNSLMSQQENGKREGDE